jgi:hypothetical protein
MSVNREEIEGLQPHQGTCNPKEWEEDYCKFEYRGTNSRGVQSYYCFPHQQWSYRFPVKTKFVYADGSEVG